MQIKIVLRFDLTPARISVSKKIKNSGEDVDQSESFFHCIWETADSMEIGVEVLKKKKVVLHVI